MKLVVANSQEIAHLKSLDLIGTQQMIAIDIIYSWESEGLVNDSSEILSLGYWRNLGAIKRNTKVKVKI